MARPSRGTAGLLALVALSGCAGVESTGTITTEVANTPGFVPGVPPGYQCPLIPNGFDPVGSIYRLERNGTYYRVKDFSQEPAIMAPSGVKRDVLISNYALSDKQLASAGLSLEVLKNAMPGLTADASADLKKEIGVSILVEDMRGEVIDDVVADKIAQWFKANVRPKPGNKYFLVRETVKAGSVSYSLKHEDVAKLGGKAQMESLAKTSANVTVKDNNGVFEIKQKFTPERIPVCIKSDEIVVSPGQGGTVALKSADEASPPEIKRVGKATN